MPAYAQEPSDHPLFTEKWLIRVGGQRSDANVKIGLANPELGEIPVIDIGAGDADTTLNSFWGNVLWRVGDRWSLGLNFFEAETKGTRVSDQDFTFGDLTIPAGTGVTSNFTTDFYVLNGYYDVYQGPGRAVGIGLGLYALDLETSLALQVGGEPNGERESADVLAPLPTLSAYYKHAFTDQLGLMVDGGWLSVNIDDYDGRILAAKLSIEYWLSKNWGLGLGYKFVDVDVTVDRPIFDQRYEVDYNSFFLFATFGF